APCIEVQMARTATARGLLIQQTQSPSFRIDAERAHRPAGFALKAIKFPNRIQEVVVRVDCEERRIFGLRRQSRFCELASFWIKPGGIDAFALCAGVSADVYELRFFGSARGGGGERRRRSKSREHKQGQQANRDPARKNIPNPKSRIPLTHRRPARSGSGADLQWYDFELHIRTL